MKNVRIALWMVVVLGLGASLYLWQGRSSTPQTSGTLAESDTHYGAPFTLTTHTGERVSNSDFAGRYMLIFFGYSLCPDICPVELEKITAAFEMLEGEGLDTSPIQPLFITLDPARDTVENLADFITQYHSSLLALTGTQDEINAVADAYNVYREKVGDVNSNAYLMNHLWADFLMDGEGNYVRIFTARDTPKDMADALRPILGQAG